MSCSPCRAGVFPHCEDSKKVLANSVEAILFAARLRQRSPFWEAVERKKEEMAKQYGGHKEHYHQHGLYHASWVLRLTD
jgi:hypothetical protein